jgi:hypothetical protein
MREERKRWGDLRLGNRGGINVWTTFKEPGVVSVMSLGEEGM